MTAHAGQPGGVSAGAALAGLPPGLRSDLLDALNTITRNFREERWEPAELNGGKLSEAAYSILHGHVSGSYSSRANKPPNMVAACQALEQSGQRFSRSVRIQIPRMLMALYEIRNNRGVGHAGGDINPNQMDATAVLYMAKWVVAELVRLLHELDVDEAALVVEHLIEREVPIIWEVGGVRRVLEPELSASDKVLLLLYSVQGPVAVEELRTWVGYTNRTRFRREVLRAAHRAALLEFDEGADTAQLSPRGGLVVEQRLPLIKVMAPAAGRA